MLSFVPAIPSLLSYDSFNPSDHAYVGRTFMTGGRLTEQSWGQGNTVTSTEQRKADAAFGVMRVKRK